MLSFHGMEPNQAFLKALLNFRKSFVHNKLYAVLSKYILDYIFNYSDFRMRFLRIY